MNLTDKIALNEEASINGNICLVANLFINSVLICHYFSKHFNITIAVNIENTTSSSNLKQNITYGTLILLTLS